MYKDILVLQPYFFSLREINNTLSLDIKIPEKWNFNNIIVKYETVKVKVQDKNTENCLLSLISTSDDDGYTKINECAREIIKTNIEEEEKLRLFNEKVSELQKLFTNMSLDDLKNLNFKDENSDRKRDRNHGEGKIEIPKGIGNSKKQID
jgi:hypothetical protein